MERLIGYQKSVVDLSINFDKNKEREFGSILDKQYGRYRNVNGSGKKLSREESLQIKPSVLSKYLHADFVNRKNEIQRFRRQSQCAVTAPILTQALVKKTRKFLDKSQVSKICN